MNKIWLAAAALVALPVVANAQQAGQWYVSGAAGYSRAHDVQIDSAATRTEVNLDKGYVLLTSFGRRFGTYRAEAELSYSHNDADSATNAAVSTGSSRPWSLLANLIMDIPTGGRWTPYMGVGLGVSALRVEATNVGGTSVSDEGAGFAAQGLFGTSYAVNDRWELFGDFRYLAIPEVNIRAANGTGFGADLRDSRMMLGVRYWLGGAMAAPAAPAAPAPAATPAPAPAPAPQAQAQPAPAQPSPTPAAQPAPPPRNYIVFFDWDKSDITQQAAGIIKTASDNAKRLNNVRIEATGHADRSGPEAYNQRLSQRRADAVKRELVKNGVRESDIAVFAKGETQPLVPTADGVREPQNRRVEIVLK